jgi:hypothetical protein
MSLSLSLPHCYWTEQSPACSTFPALSCKQIMSRCPPYPQAFQKGLSTIVDVRKGLFKTRIRRTGNGHCYAVVSSVVGLMVSVLRTKWQIAVCWTSPASVRVFSLKSAVWRKSSVKSWVPETVRSGELVSSTSAGSVQRRAAGRVVLSSTPAELVSGLKHTESCEGKLLQNKYSQGYCFITQWPRAVNCNLVVITIKFACSKNQTWTEPSLNKRYALQYLYEGYFMQDRACKWVSVYDTRFETSFRALVYELSLCRNGRLQTTATLCGYKSYLSNKLKAFKYWFVWWRPVVVTMVIYSNSLFWQAANRGPLRPTVLSVT